MSASDQRPTPADKRRGTRYPCNITATVIIDRVEHDVRVKDVSALGCCFAADLPLQKGDEVVCRIRGITAVATVAWAAPPLVGANFHRDIDLKQVLRDANERATFLNRRLAQAMTTPPRRD